MITVIVYPHHSSFTISYCDTHKAELRILIKRHVGYGWVRLIFMLNHLPGLICPIDAVSAEN